MNKAEIMTKEEIMLALEALTQEPGFLYSLVIVLRHDLFLNLKELADMNWRERLSFQEASLLVGLMIKHKVELSVFPDEKASKNQVSRIYELFQKLHDAYNLPIIEKLFIESKEIVAREGVEKAYNDFFGGGEVMTEPIFYGGSGAYDFQYWEFAPKKYQEDDAWIKANKGVSISEMVAISASLKKFHEDRWHNLQDIKTFEDFCRTCLSIFCFNYEDLNSFDKSILEKFIKIFSVEPGTVNQNLNSVGAYNAVDSHPIILLGENLFFLPIGFSIAQSIYESPFYWMRVDEHYKDTAFRNRGETTEKIAYEILESVFNKGNIYRNVKVLKNKKELITDVDVLAIAGNKAVIVQAKSKKLTELSKRGDDEKLKTDFEEAVQRAYDQGLSCRTAIIDKSNMLVTEDGKELQLGEFIDDAYIICLTSDYYPAVTHQTDVYLKKTPKDPYPLAMSIFDLDIVAFYLKDPFELLYYLRQRVNLSNYYKASSEMALLGCHLRQKLYLRPGVDREALDEGFAQLIDANFPAMKGHHPKTSAVEKLHHKWKNEKFQQLVTQVKSSKEAGFTDAIFYLYDLAGQGADDLVKVIEQTKEKTRRDGQSHDFSMIFEKGKSGVTFLSSADSPENLERWLMPLAIARKYKTKADVWLALGAVAGSPNLVDAITFNKQLWKEDKELDELSKIVLKEGVQMKPDGRKIGRNDPCYCGSGKKFKKCCGR